MDTEMEKLNNDEVVAYMAHRYHATPSAILQRFFEQKDNVGIIKVDKNGDEVDIRLEDNEMEILQGLLVMAQHNR